MPRRNRHTAAHSRSIHIYAEAHHNLGIIEQQRGALDEAAKDFREAIADRPDYPLARFHLGRILVNQEKYAGGDPAISAGAWSLQSERTPACLYALGATYARPGDRSAAHRISPESARCGRARIASRSLQTSIERDLKALQTMTVSISSRRDLFGAWCAGGALAARFCGAADEPAIFRDVAAEAGLDFRHFNFATGRHYMPEIMGPGVACSTTITTAISTSISIQGTRLDATASCSIRLPRGWKPGNRLYKNLLAETGELKFVDVTEKAGVGHVGYGMGVAAGDYDNDGFLDLYVTNFGRNVLYHNNGDGTFTDVTREAGVDDPHWSTSAAWVDFDGDGWLDLFVCNYVDFTVEGNRGCFSPAGEAGLLHAQDVSCRALAPVSKSEEREIRGYHEKPPASIGSYGPALGVVCADFNGDGRTDIYVANDTAANHLWLNQGDGTFREAALDHGVAYSMDGLAKAGMGVTLGDVENNGRQVLLVTNLTREGVTAFRGDASGQFDDVTAQFGLAAADLRLHRFRHAVV